MEKINLLSFHQKKHQKKKIAAALFAIVFLIFGATFASFKIFYQTKEVNTGANFFTTLSHLILSSERELAYNKKNINLLFLGMGGPGHEGPYLADTILLASFNKEEKKAALLSVPRDLLVDTYRYGKQKINHLNSLSEAEQANSGARFTKDVLEEILGVSIDYYLRVDFESFRKIIDAVGGIDIIVPRAFSDPLFPRESKEGNSGETITITFRAGPQRMDGQTALIYARSRHGNNGEGSDFARSRRQQQILIALKEKIFSLDTLLNPTKVKQIIKSLETHIATNINAWEALQLAKIYGKLNLKLDEIMTNILTSGPDGPLYSDYYNNQYVLLPKKSDWSDIKKIADHPFDAIKTRFVGQNHPSGAPSILILNGTNVNGLAGAMAMTLGDFGYQIKNISNAPYRNFEKNVIYNIGAREDKKEALIEIKNILGANIAADVPEWLKENLPEKDQPDFVIIVGAEKTAAL